jgi:hypothetical protein
VRTTSVRINGLPYKVPAGELAGPTTFNPSCGAREPEAWGGAICTLPAHDADVVHIARSRLSGLLVAIWAGYLADPRERVEAADLAEPVGA